jgi:hypothetical protein
MCGCGIFFYAVAIFLLQPQANQAYSVLFPLLKFEISTPKVVATLRTAPNEKNLVVTKKMTTFVPEKLTNELQTK